MRETRTTYRRRRLGALLAAAALAFALYAGTVAGGDAGAEPPPVYHTVEPGETLWEITAEHYPPSDDPRPIIEGIRAENSLDGYEIRPGMRLELSAPE